MECNLRCASFDFHLLIVNENFIIDAIAENQTCYVLLALIDSECFFVVLNFFICKVLCNQVVFRHCRKKQIGLLLSDGLCVKAIC